MNIEAIEGFHPWYPMIYLVLLTHMKLIALMAMHKSMCFRHKCLGSDVNEKIKANNDNRWEKKMVLIMWLPVKMNTTLISWYFTNWLHETEQTRLVKLIQFTVNDQCDGFCH